MTAHLASRVQRHGVTLFAMTGMVLMTGAVIANGGTGRGTANGSDGTVSICHATASASNPYVAITVSVNGLNGHGGHEDDIVPAPEEGCPEDDGDDETGDDGDSDSPYGYPETVTICHATESAKNPFVEITVSVNGLNGHGDHEDDIVPAPEDGCPAGDDDEDDDDEDEKVWICHLADSQQYVLIRVSVNGLEGHGDHDGDVVPAPDEGCPTDDGEDDTVDLCHLADNQQYVPLTVSVNGLNGHGDHEGDIVPAPEEGCPDTPCVDDCPPPPCEETDTCPPPPCEETDTCPPPPCEETDTCP
ncbi:MAG TPA: hypothetical protein VI997_01260, partial [Candidatus Thermoplasmatota archaeon]|nr:hypothetical protein [Candidatus Thermoplasmatota archaeon]